MARRLRARPVVTMAGGHPEISTPRVGVADPADPQADPATQADLEDPADPAGPATQADPADPAEPAGPATQADPDHGVGIRSVVTSTGRRGETDPRPGGGARRRRQPGADPYHLPVASGGVAQSTTGATRKLPSGIPGSTSGAFGSSEYGSRCRRPTRTTPGSAAGDPGVVHTPPMRRPRPIEPATQRIRGSKFSLTAANSQQTLVYQAIWLRNALSGP
jgi:hypothetical protein